MIALRHFILFIFAKAGDPFINGGVFKAFWEKSGQWSTFEQTYIFTATSKHFSTQIMFFF